MFYPDFTDWTFDEEVGGRRIHNVVRKIQEDAATLAVNETIEAIKDSPWTLTSEKSEPVIGVYCLFGLADETELSIPFEKLFENAEINTSDISKKALQKAIDAVEAWLVVAKANLAK